VTPTWKVSQSTCAANAEEPLTDVGECSVKQARLAPFSRMGYTVVRTTNDSDSDRLLSFDDDPGFDAETVRHVRHREDNQMSLDNCA